MPIGFEPASLFDGGNPMIEFSFLQLQVPIRTKAGKVLLLVKG